jgi:ABC-type antimicrobial peptide transport system permease subunit
LKVAIPGLAVGLAAGLGLSRILGSFLLGLAPTDLVTFVVGPGLLLVVVGLACWGPARRAAALRPVEALRAD